MRNVFGWPYPRGQSLVWLYGAFESCACDVCGQSLDDCICPECSVCHGVGDPACYDAHGLTRSFAQVALRAQADQFIEEDAKRDSLLWEELEQERKLADEYFSRKGQ